MFISEVENNKIMAENIELKARIAKLEDKQSQNEIIKKLIICITKDVIMYFWQISAEALLPKSRKFFAN